MIVEGMKKIPMRPGILPRFTSVSVFENMVEEEKERIERELDEEAQSIPAYLKWCLADETRTRGVINEIIRSAKADENLYDILTDLAFDHKEEVKEFLIWLE